MKTGLMDVETSLSRKTWFFGRKFQADNRIQLVLDYCLIIPKRTVTSLVLFQISDFVLLTTHFQGIWIVIYLPKKCHLKPPVTHNTVPFPIGQLQPLFCLE